MGVSVRKVFGVLLVLGLMSSAATAQTKTEAIDAYNEAASLLKAEKKAEALAAFEKCVELSEALGAEGDETLQMAAAQIPKLQYDIALNNLKKRNFEEALKGFENAQKSADKYSDARVAAAAKKRLPQVHYYSAVDMRKAGDLEGALATYDKTLAADPTYVKAQLAKVLIYREMGQTEKMYSAIDKTMALAEQENDRKSLMTARKVATTTSYNAAVKALQAQNFSEAVGQFEKSISYGNQEPLVFYQLGLAYNNMNQWDSAIEKLQQALQLEDGGNEDKARIYYELGNAYAGKGDTTKACDAFKNAMYGNYLENAKYQVEHVLNCDGSSL